MCGIVGFYNSSQSSVNLQVLQAMAKSMKYRGPDDEGYYLRGPVGLGHVRLSILDLSPLGRQPMKSRNKDCYLILNGEIYNFLELKKELSEEGYTFESRTDTEVLLYALEAWGISTTLQKVNGMFAFAYWMEEEGKLILARDRLGKKPIYYYQKGGHFVFGSELKSILEYPYVEKEIDTEALIQYFAYSYVPNPYSIVKHARKLSPACYLEYCEGNVTLNRYWDPYFSRKTVVSSNISEEEVMDQLSQLLKSSIHYRLISDVPLGVFLSGGIDSTAVTALLMEHSNKKIKTFSIGFQESEFNEAPVAKRVASYLGTEHHEYYLKPSEVLSSVEEIMAGFDEPFGDSSLVPTYFVSKKCREEITVALGGDGGDELFGGYIKYRQIQQARTIASWMPDGVRKMLFAAISKLPHDTLRKGARGLMCDDDEGLLQYLSMAWKEKELGQLIHGMTAPFSNESFAGLARGMRCEELIDAMMRIDLQSYLPDDILTKVDRTSMFNSLEVRAPLLDYRIVEFVIALPMHLKIRGKNQKYLLKKLLAKYIPMDEILHRKKMGFCLPINQWFHGDLRYLLDSYLSEESIKKVGFFNYPVIKKIVSEHLQGGFDHSRKLFTLLGYQIWHDRYVQKLL